MSESLSDEMRRSAARMIAAAKAFGDGAALNERQADGQSCVSCDRDDRPMAPAGTLNGVQVFSCCGDSCTYCGGQGFVMAGKGWDSAPCFSCAGTGRKGDA